MELFTYHLKNQFKEKSEYLDLVHDLIVTLNGSTLFIEAFLNSKVLDEWINFGIR